MITDMEIDFMPEVFSEDARNLLEGLLDRNPRKRLGSKCVEDVQKHPFFYSVNWSECLMKRIKPLFVPKIASEDDLSNIDKMFTREPPRETPATDASLLSDAKFANFTYCEDKSLAGLRKSKTQTWWSIQS